MVVLLWVFALQHMTRAPDRWGREYRIDRKEAVAYPYSDAFVDYLNAIAIVSGDGWVHWRRTNRWSAYRPGWAAFLAGLATVYGRDPEAMQRLITVLLAGVTPAFFLLITSLFPSPRSPPIAAAAAVLFTVNAPHVSWWFQNTMMTEGPTLLLSLLFCSLALRLGVAEPKSGPGGTASRSASWVRRRAWFARRAGSRFSRSCCCWRP